MKKMDNLAELFVTSVRRWPDNPALWVSGDVYTYRELFEKALLIAQTIQTVDYKFFPAHVAIFSYRSALSYYSVLGALLAGMTYIPLNPRFPLYRNTQILKQSDARVLIVDNQYIQDVQAVLEEESLELLVIFPELDVLPSWCARLKKCKFLCRHNFISPVRNYASVELESNCNAYILFTSGSTGIPKSVMINHGNVLAYLQNISKFINVSCSDRFTQLSALTFDPSVHDMFLCWQAGACLYVLPEMASLLAGRFVQEHELTMWYSVPSTAAMLNQHDFLVKNAFPTLRCSFFCGEALPASLAAKWQEAAPNSKLYNLYGPTEATISITAYQWKKEDNLTRTGIVPIGFPFDSEFAVIVDENLHLITEVGVKGELCLTGAQLSPGYRGDDELNQKCFCTIAATGKTSKWYRTGDLVSWHQEDGFVFHGRIDRQIKIRGFRVELQEIESSIRKISGVEMVAVVGGKKNPSGGFLGSVCFIVGKDLPSSEDIIEDCRKKLPDYMVPEIIYKLDDLPMNSNGKIDYNALQKLEKINSSQIIKSETSLVE